MSSSNAPSGPDQPDPAPETPRNTGVDVTPIAVDSPPAAIEVGAPSGERRSRQPRRQSPRGASEDTLLSMPAPAPSFEVEVEDRLSDQERRLEDLANRVRILEGRQGQPGSAGQALASQSWLVWVVFLLALAVAWQIFTRGR